MPQYKKIKKPLRTNHKASQQSAAKTPEPKLHSGATSQTKSQEYSALVFKNVQALLESNNDKDTIKRYKSLCKRSGGLLRSVGLIQFLSFLAAKATKDSEVHHQYLLNHLTAELNSVDIIKAQNSDGLLEKIRQQNLAQYMHTTTRVLKLLQWHKRIADILITGDAG